MKIGYIGLGKMGQGMVLNMQEKGHVVFSYNRSEEGRLEAKKAGVKNVSESIKDMVLSLEAPRVVWVMVSHAGVDDVLKELYKHLDKNDLIIEGGNSFYKNTVVRSKEAKKRGFRFMDVGVSGGPGGARKGACLMVGGNESDFEMMKNLFKDISVPEGYEYFGKSGAGHFAKMIHNGIEYGMMQAIAEGFDILRHSDFKFDLRKVSNLYGNGSVIESRLITWLTQAYMDWGKDLKPVSGSVAHSGEGEWTVKVAKEMGINVKVIEDAFKFRVNSKSNPSYAGKVLSALRNKFGHHSIKNK